MTTNDLRAMLRLRSRTLRWSSAARPSRARPIRPEDLRAMFKALGFTAADLRHCQWMASTIPEERLREVVEELVRMQRKGERG